MRRKYKSLLGSQRTSYFKEAKSRPTKHRPQQVRFRRRYATSVLTVWGKRLWTLVQGTVFVGVTGAAVFYGTLFWHTSPLLKISSVQFIGNPPQKLSPYLAIKSGQNIFTIHPQRLENEALGTFKELKSISIDRHLDRRVSVEVSYRQPLAEIGISGQTFGIDENGIYFPISETHPPVPNPPQLIGFVQNAELTETMKALSTIFRELPDFYFLIKILKTDRMQPLRIILKNDVTIFWGEMNDSTAVGRAKKVVTVLNSFEPKKGPASLRFITDDRLVMDSQWKAKK